jgi:hypothetical protein
MGVAVVACGALLDQGVDQADKVESRQNESAQQHSRNPYSPLQSRDRTESESSIAVTTSVISFFEW